MLSLFALFIILQLHALWLLLGLVQSKSQSKQRNKKEGYNHQEQKAENVSLIASFFYEEMASLHNFKKSLYNMMRNSVPYDCKPYLL